MDNRERGTGLIRTGAAVSLFGSGWLGAQSHILPTHQHTHHHRGDDGKDTLLLGAIILIGMKYEL